MQTIFDNSTFKQDVKAKETEEGPKIVSATPDCILRLPLYFF